MAMKVPNNSQPKNIPLVRLLLLGVMKQLSDVFNVPEKRIVPISSTDRMKVAQKIAERDNEGEILFPQMLLYVTNVIRGDQEQTYNARTLSRAGLYTKLDDNQNAIGRIHIIPVILEVEVIYQTNDYFGGLEYATRWMSAGLHRRLNFSMTYMNFDFDIPIDMAATVVVPEQDASIDIPNYYEYDTGIRVMGYLESEHPDDTDRVVVLRQLETDVQAVFDVTASAKKISCI
jgi:hypothetical protein